MQRVPQNASISPPATLSGIRVLIADDDDASRFFLEEALHGFGCEVSTCVDGTAAFELASVEYFHLLLLDRRMPGAGAAEVLARLRTRPDTGSGSSRAVVTSAELPPAIRAQLLAQGFVGVLEKPCDLACLRDVVLDALPDDAIPPILDDEAALICSGDVQTVHALRALLRDELLHLRDEFDMLASHPKALEERLHRLRSACGFCGASRLLVQTRALQKTIVSDAPLLIATSLAHFRHELDATIDSLEPLDA
jgi:CheY-like chemotaxis protein